MLSLETEADDDDESSDEDVSFAEMLARLAKEKEETRKDASFFCDGDGMMTTRTSPPMSTATKESLLHPARTKGKHQPLQRTQYISVWLLAGNRWLNDPRWH